MDVVSLDGPNCDWTSASRSSEKFFGDVILASGGSAGSRSSAAPSPFLNRVDAPAALRDGQRTLVKGIRFGVFALGFVQQSQIIQ